MCLTNPLPSTHPECGVACLLYLLDAMDSDHSLEQSVESDGSDWANMSIQIFRPECIDLSFSNSAT